MEKKVNAEWTQDCSQKQDYDGSIISLSTRFWPPRYQSNAKFSAKSSIHLDFKNYPEYLELISKEFEGDTEAEVKFKVEQWAQEQYERIIHILPKEFPNKKWWFNPYRTGQLICYFAIGVILGFLLTVLYILSNPK